MSVDPHGMLKFVEPDLVKVILAASQTVPFVVVYGVRTLLAEKDAVATGHSTTLHSRHLADHRGFSAAVDVAALVNGEPNWAPGHELKVFGAISVQIKAAARALRIEVQWGGDWITFKDWGHFQLPWELYP